MLTYQQIIAFVQDYDPKLDRHPMYEKWNGVYYGMSLHIDGAQPRYTDLRTGKKVVPVNFFGEEYQHIFDTVLFNKHPREDETTRQWRMGRYKPFQQDPFLRIISTVKGSIFQDSGYGIEIDNKDDYDYVWAKSFDGKNIVEYFSDKMQNIFEDPNGLFVVIPKEAGYATTTDRIEPDIIWVPSRYIQHKSRDEVVFKYGDFIWVINSVGYFRFTKDDDGNVTNVDGNDRGYYAHGLGFLPVFVAGGIWNTQGFYDSWLNAGKAWADNYVMEMSSSQLVNKEASHPIIIEAAVECSNNECISGYVRVPCDDGEYDTIPCKVCNGKDHVSRNPGERMIVPADKMAHQLVQIVNPEVAINEFHLKNTDTIYKALEKALNLSYIDESQSAIAKDRDMETRYQFLSAISNDLFGRLIDGVIRCIIGIRNVTTIDGISRPDFGNYSITRPSEFGIKTASILLSEYKSATDANVPDFIKAKHLEDYVDKQYGGDEILRRKTMLINELDIVALKSEQDKQIAILNGSVQQRDLQFSVRLPRILDQIVREKGNDWFIESRYDIIESEVSRIFDLIVPPMPQIPPDPSQFNEEEEIIV
jgi:hypothetical protein